MSLNNISNSNKIEHFPLKENSSLRVTPFIATEPLPKLILEKDIFTLMQTKMNITEEIKDIIEINYNKQDSYIENVKEVLTENKIKKKKVNIEKIEKKFKIGRKTNHDASIRTHNKFSPDNIINKIKNFLKRYLINFVNNIINILYSGEKRKYILSKLNIFNNWSSFLIKDIDYKLLADKKANSIIYFY
jgi:hypothetical protein